MRGNKLYMYTQYLPGLAMLCVRPRRSRRGTSKGSMLINYMSPTVAVLPQQESSGSGRQINSSTTPKICTDAVSMSCGMDGWIAECHVSQSRLTHHKERSNATNLVLKKFSWNEP